MGESTLAEPYRPADEPADAGPLPLPRLRGGSVKRRSLVKASAFVKGVAELTPPQRLLLLDTWQRSGLPAGDFAAMVGVSKHTLYGWKKKFDAEGPGGLVDRPRGGPKGPGC